MKPLKERLPLIDAAIDALDGQIPKNAIGVFLSKRGHKSFAVKSIEDSGFMSPASIGDKTDGGAYHVCHENWDFISSDEFNERKAELEAKEQDMNDWYEKDMRVSFPTGEGVLILPEADSNGVVIVRNDYGEYKRVAASAIKPLRTEHELVRSGILDIIEANGNLSNGILADTLVEAGYRKTKPMSEDEFVEAHWDKFGASGARELYKLGFVQLNQGE